MSSHRSVSSLPGICALSKGLASHTEGPWGLGHTGGLLSRVLCLGTAGFWTAGPPPRVTHCGHLPATLLSSPPISAPCAGPAHSAVSCVGPRVCFLGLSVLWALG